MEYAAIELKEGEVMQIKAKPRATQIGHVASNMPQPRASTSMAAGLSVGLCIMVAGGVQATNTHVGSYVNPKDKSPVHLVVGASTLKAVSAADDSAPNPPSWVQDLGWIKEHADVTVSRLADVFGVTRKAFYGWIDGAEPRKGGSLIRISVLREILAGLPSIAHRSAFFGLIDDISGDGTTFREVFQSSVDGPGYRDRLNGKLAELAPALDVAAKRINRSAGSSRSFETDYPAA